MIDPSCGNRTLEGDEACDDGMESATCDVDCTPVECGDGRINRTAGERCDDGNGDTSDACDASCQPSIFVVDSFMGSGESFIGFQPSVHTVVDGGDESFLVAYTAIDEAVGNVNVRRYSTLGGELGAGVKISDGADADLTPAIAQNGDGVVFVTWSDFDTNELRFRLLGPDGTPMGAVQPIPESLNVAYNAVVQATPTGTFCVQWHDAVERRLKLRCFDADGSPLGTTSDYAPSDPSGDGQIIGPTELVPYQGGFLSLFWETEDQLAGTVLDGAGNKVGGDNPIGTALGFSWTAGVAVSAGSNFLVAWSAQADLPDGDDIQVEIQPMLNQTTADGTPVRFTTGGVQHVGYEMVQNDNRIAFVYGETPTGTNIFEGCALKIHRIDSSGHVMGEETTIAPLQIGACPLFADAAVSADGSVFVSWTRFNGAAMTISTEAMVLPGYLAP